MPYYGKRDTLSAQDTLKDIYATTIDQVAGRSRIWSNSKHLSSLVWPLATPVFDGAKDPTSRRLLDLRLDSFRFK